MGEPARPRPKAITIAVLAMGGEGGGVLADWIVDVAEHNGYEAQSTSVPGVAQRTGATIYYLELFPESAAVTAGREPVLSLMPTPGQVDIVLCSELMETGRAIQRGLVTPHRTLLITSTHRVFSMSERTAMGDGTVNAEKLQAAGKAAAKTFIAGDYAQLAETSRSVISSVLFGALAGAKALPFAREQFEDAIRRGEIGVETSLKAFDAGYRNAQEQGAPSVAVPTAALEPKPGRALAGLAQRVSQDFPIQTHEVLLAGIVRLADYQDVHYAEEYLDLLKPLRDTATPVTLQETARHLALWMSYEDAVRVADLKTRSTRFQRVGTEVRASVGQIVEIREFLHPGLNEIADILPARVGAALLGSALIRRMSERWMSKGKILNTTSLRGFLQLYGLAKMRSLRRSSLRYRKERNAMERWLEQLRHMTAVNPTLAREFSESPRLLKGYGSTHELGSRNFDLISAVLPALNAVPNGAETLKRLHAAALSDDTGQQLTAAIAGIEQVKEAVL